MEADRAFDLIEKFEKLVVAALNPESVIGSDIVVYRKPIKKGKKINI